MLSDLQRLAGMNAEIPKLLFLSTALETKRVVCAPEPTRELGGVCIKIHVRASMKSYLRPTLLLV
jgi:hypothetical protein